MQTRHIARILQVSRTTASNWLTGKRQPHILLSTQVDKFMRAVHAAVASGDLPPPPDLPADERSAKVVAVIRHRLREVEG